MDPLQQLRSQAARIILRQFSMMMSQERGALLGEDIECLHRMRVASRRLRARIEDFEVLFKGRSYSRIQKFARRITRRLGAARDLDVFEEFLESLLPNERFRKPTASLLQAVEKPKARSRLKLAAFLKQARRRGVVGKIRRYFRKHSLIAVKKSSLRARMRSFSCQVIRPRLESLQAFRRKRFTGVGGALDLHRMRIQAKKLRYSMEIFEIYYGKEFARCINQVRALQDAAGRVRDLELHARRIRAYEEGGIVPISL